MACVGEDCAGAVQFVRPESPEAIRKMPAIGRANSRRGEKRRNVTGFRGTGQSVIQDIGRPLRNAKPGIVMMRVK